MGSGVFNGAFTTGVGFVPLLWAQMPMFVVFAQVFMMIISLGLLHGFIALPLMLAQWGPPPSPSTTARRMTMTRAMATGSRTHTPRKSFSLCRNCESVRRALF